MTYRPTRSAKLDWPTVREIRRLYAEGRSQGFLTRQFGVSIAQIGRIIRQEAWLESDRPTEQTFYQESSMSMLQKMLSEANQKKAEEAKVDKDLKELQGDKHGG